MNNIDTFVKSRFRGLLVFSIFVGLLTTRRWSQIVSPQVWDEDGTQVIYEFLTKGSLALLEPVNGYLITVPKFISGLSLWISVLNYPLVSNLRPPPHDSSFVFAPHHSRYASIAWYMQSKAATNSTMNVNPAPAMRPNLNCWVNDSA